MRLWRLSLFAVALSFLVPGGISAQAQQRGPQVIYAQDELPDGETPGVVPDQQEASTEFQKQVVFFRTNEPPGTLIVHTSERFLYLVLGNNKALRYGVGVGRDGFTWQGLHKITRKQEWPDWRPPPEMIERQPYLPRFMAGGPGNPLGARALYIGNTIYRIHGTNQPHTIGHAVSSGCFRLVNNDVIDLFERVEVGTRVIVRHAPQM
ncbi:MAG: L,D-transpeptidase [Xanthobacteraceae bacterium]|mgnify:CR=1 FL=1|nr:L,D-transpeptidase [Xanthobacteraceae bacterium]QYK46488.1 MAG: L,D-transpeptidase [Xanthobacteraceae bacterium]